MLGFEACTSPSEALLGVAIGAVLAKALPLISAKKPPTPPIKKEVSR